MQNSSQTTIHPIDASVQSSHAQVEVHNIADATGEPLDEVEWTQIKSDLLNKAFKRLDPIFKYGGKIQEVVNELDGLFEEMNEKFPCNTESISAFFNQDATTDPAARDPARDKGQVIASLSTLQLSIKVDEKMDQTRATKQSAEEDL